MPTTEPAPFRFLTVNDLTVIEQNTLAWLWMPYLARGMLTLFTSRWKAGKTTLLSVLLAKQASGGELAGSDVLPAKSLIVSEEPPAMWAVRQQRLQLGAHIQWACRPFHGRPSMEQWVALIDRIAQANPDLVVIDTVGTLLPAMAECNASTIATVLDPLHALTDQGAAVLLIHHPRKGSAASEMSPRGSGALTSYVDILCELDYVPKAPLTDRRRRLRAASRLHEHTQRTLWLNEDETEYTVLDDPTLGERFDRGWAVLKLVLEGNCVPLTRVKALDRWPADYEKPAVSTLNRWLEKAAAQGLVERRGLGNRFSPYRYALPGRDDLYEESLPDDYTLTHLHDRQEKEDYQKEERYHDEAEKRTLAEAARKAKREAKKAAERVKSGGENEAFGRGSISDPVLES